MRQLSFAPITLVLPLVFFSACSDEDPPTNADASLPDVYTGLPDAANADATTADDAGVDAGEDDAGATNPAFPRKSCAGLTNCFELEDDEVAELYTTLNSLENGATVILGTGTFDLNNAFTVRNATGVTISGQGIDATILSFANQPAQSNGVDVIGDDFTIEHLTITDSKKDGLRIEDSTNVWIHHVKVTWLAGPQTTNGSYGIYPVRCTNVLLEDSEAYNASDAGLYVGQSINVIVRRSIARDNVAGLEIENTQYAEVYENTVENNSGGLLVFDLPGNPVIGRDVLIRNNIIRQNNRANFAPSGTTVSNIPAGTGTFALASRRVEIRNNTYENNYTTDIAILSGLAIRSSTAAWAIPVADARGTLTDLNLITDGTNYLNFRSDEIYIHDNTHSGTGTRPDDSDQTARPLGVLLAILYFGTEVDELLYDGIGEVVDPLTAANNTNNNHLCVENKSDGTAITVLDLPKLEQMAGMGDLPTLEDVYRPAAPYAPFDCTGFTAGPIAPVVLPFGG